jgi:hypothetical protein
MMLVERSRRSETAAAASAGLRRSQASRIRVGTAHAAGVVRDRLARGQVCRLVARLGDHHVHGGGDHQTGEGAAGAGRALGE